jgi:tRNA threonylcarbamoyladenosine biosynthesis protein TsaB
MLVSTARLVFDRSKNMFSDPDPPHPILVIDTASPTTAVGLSGLNDIWSWHVDDRASDITLFQGVDRLLKERGISLGRIRTLVYCEGPGSMLGIRTAVMAIRTWISSGVLRNATLTAYSSLGLAAAGIQQSKSKGKVTIAIDARRQSWYCLTTDPVDPNPPRIKRVNHREIDRLPGPVYLPDKFPIWNPCPESWMDLPYDPLFLESPKNRRMLLRSVDRPEAYQLDPPSYQRWTPMISRSHDRSPRSEDATP